MSQSQIDILDPLLAGNPNEAATKGVVLLLRSEVRSDFQLLDRKMDQRFIGMDHELLEIKKYAKSIAEQVGKNTVDIVDLRTSMNKRFDLIHEEIGHFKTEFYEFKHEMLGFKQEMGEFKTEMLGFKQEMSEFKHETTESLKNISQQIKSLTEIVMKLVPLDWK